MTEMDNLEKIWNERQTRYKSMEQMNRGVYALARYHNALKTCQSGRAIKSFCHECLGYTNKSSDILGCCGFGCSLYFSRPYKYPDTDEVQDIIRKREHDLYEQIFRKLAENCTKRAEQV